MTWMSTPPLGQADEEEGLERAACAGCSPGTGLATGWAACTGRRGRVAADPGRRGGETCCGSPRSSSFNSDEFLQRDAGPSGSERSTQPRRGRRCHENLRKPKPTTELTAN
ncbi:hypothetical protein EYF80_039788 [Liparis tanakae]|uniref:Uncharacterized protein n=1 Tax=Liparis tanakae TaxID=230148 RepID=A0A4Z2G9U7_9TELE|nr:hypothetical protein EYF80_039788 [Liparis tanakae]